MKIYGGGIKRVLAEMTAENLSGRIARRESAWQRKLAARLRKEEVEAREDRGLLSYDGYQINHLWGRKERRY